MAKHQAEGIMDLRERNEEEKKKKNTQRERERGREQRKITLKKENIFSSHHYIYSKDYLQIT